MLDIDKLKDHLGRAERFEVPDPDGVVFDRPVHRAPHPLAPPQPKVLVVSTLSALAEYVTVNIDDVDLEKHLIHVDSPTCVEVISALSPFHRHREVLIRAAVSPPEFKDVDLPLEKAVALVMTMADSPDRERLLDRLKHVRVDQAEIQEDSGMDQSLTVRRGIQKPERASMENPFLLRPWRSFAEVEQVQSPFVVRLHDHTAQRGGVHVTFLEADGGMWQLQQVQIVAQYLKDTLDVPIIY